MRNGSGEIPGNVTLVSGPTVLWRAKGTPDFLRRSEKLSRAPWHSCLEYEEEVVDRILLHVGPSTRRVECILDRRRVLFEIAHEELAPMARHLSK